MGTYVRPIVMVMQEYKKLSVTTQAATLYPCVIGPCYHVLDVDKDEILSYVGTVFGNGAVGKSPGLSGQKLPNNFPGAKIVKSSVMLKFKDILIRLDGGNGDACKAVSISSDHLYLEFNSDHPFPSYVQTGDTINVYRADDGGGAVINVTCKAVSITEPTDSGNQDTKKIKVSKYIPNPSTPVTDQNNLYSLMISRQVPDVTLSPWGTDNVLTLSDYEASFLDEIPDFSGASGMKGVSVDISSETITIPAPSYELDGVPKDYISARVYVGYKAFVMFQSQSRNSFHNF